MAAVDKGGEEEEVVEERMGRRAVRWEERREVAIFVYTCIHMDICVCMCAHLVHDVRVDVLHGPELREQPVQRAHQRRVQTPAHRNIR